VLPGLLYLVDADNLTFAERRRTVEEACWNPVSSRRVVSLPRVTVAQPKRDIGQLYIHYQGIRWRTTLDVKLKRFGIGVYVHRATRDNSVWYDDVALSTGYIGPVKRESQEVTNE
jgi:hypothetical protein